MTITESVRERAHMARPVPPRRHSRLAAARPYVVAAGIGASLAILTLAWWMNPLSAVGTAVVTGGMAAAGLGLVRSGRTERLPDAPAAVLGAVISASILVLASLALVTVGLPLRPFTLLAVAGLLAAAAVARWRRTARRVLADQEDDGRPATGSWSLVHPSRAALAGSVIVSAAALAVLDSHLHRVALLAFTGALLWAISAARFEEQPAQEGRPAGGRRGLVPRVTWIPLVALAVLLATRLFPFLRSPVPLGYDTGLYRGVQQDFVEALPGLPSFAAGSWGDVQPPGLFVLSGLLHLAGASSDALLWGLLILAQVIGSIGIWLLGHQIGGTRVANWALVLFVLSSAQFVLFYQVYFKQILALALLPYVLVLWRRESWLAVPAGAFLAATHTMGFLLMGLILASDTLWSARRAPRGQTWSSALRAMLAERSYRLLAGTAILVLGLASYAFAPRAITEFVSPDVGQTLGGLGVGGDAGAGSYRLDASSYALLVLPLIPFAGLTLWQGWRDPWRRPVLLWGGWALAFVLFELIFARRFIGSLDPALILLASVSIARLTASAGGSYVRPFAAIAVVVSAVFLGRAMADLGPAIAVADLRDLQSSSRALPADAYVMAASGADMPWVRGYGQRDTIAPGFLEHDRWTRDEWDVFWAPATPAERYELLERYERPVYVFMRPERPLTSIAEDPRFERVSRTLWQYRPRSSSPAADRARVEETAHAGR